MGFIGSLRFASKITAPDTTTITFKMGRVRKNELVKVTAAMVIDYTTANKKLVLGFRDVEGTDHYVQVIQAANIFEAHLTGEIYLIEGEEAIGVVASPTTSAVCYFTVHGERYKLPGT